MLPRIRTVTYVRGYRLRLEFSDGVSGDVNLEPVLSDAKGIVADLKDLDMFQRVAVASEGGALVWPNGVDFCPDALYEEITGQSINTDQSAA